jgi:Kef-type K+ transport system membrane component KefB/nucleotide-binding universal stress UspA family protein
VSAQTPPGSPSSDPGEISTSAPKSRLTAFYVVLFLVTAAVSIAVVLVGKDREPQPEIAGGYDVTEENACLGTKFDIKQSGEFVNIRVPNEDTPSGKLRLKDRKNLTGDVKCVEGGTQDMKATVEGETIAGTLGDEPFASEKKRDPPAGGAQDPRIPDSVAGEYRLQPRSPCLGGEIELEEKGGSERVEIISEDRALGEAEYREGKLTGDVACKNEDELGRFTLGGEAADRNINLSLCSEGTDPCPSPSGVGAGGERLTAQKQREPGRTFAAFFIAIAVVMLVARLFGMAAVRLKQPRVMGEVVAGITLGPTILGLLLPDVQGALFPTDIIPFIGVVAQLGLIFYMFLVGLEIDPAQLRGRVGQAAAISNASVALPMMLGIAVALPVYELVGPDQKFIAFALFMGVSMSITAFPVLARILVERRMLKRPVGALALACAAIDDVTAWFLIALASAIAVAGSGADVIQTIVLAIVFCLVMFFAVRPLVARVSDAYDEAGRIPGGWIALIFAGVLLSAFTTEIIGIALIFGAFIMGGIMPRHAELTEDVTRRIEDFVVTLLLPLFFAFTGLRTDIGLLDRPILWLITVGLIIVAITGKLAGAYVAARLTGFKSKPAAVIGTLMNTRGLTELIVLNLALEKGVISEALFAMLVIMALVTTFMAGPILNLLDPNNELGAPVEEELEEARQRSSVEFPDLPVPEKSILLAPQTSTGLAQLRSLAEPLARSEPPRELILARLVRPPQGTEFRGGLQTENKVLREASNEVNFVRLELVEERIASRAVAFTSADPGADIARLAKNEGVDLLLIDGARPLLGEGVPRGDVGTVLQEAECDVGVLVAKEGADVLPGPDKPLLVPFGGAEHDWAALELGAWIASQTGAPLKLLGAAGQTDEGKKATRLLGDAGLLVQQYAGIAAEPVVVDPGREGVLDAAGDAGLLVVGLSDRWRQEGLGATRSEIARAAPAPVMFVRRGLRPGALAPRGDVTRFTWSTPGGGGGQGYTPGGAIG